MMNSAVVESVEQNSSLEESARKIFVEFYWLRFLEVEVNESSAFKASISYKKLGSLDKMGQSHFTVTKRLRKETEVDTEFGFESNIVWTKPCYIKSITPGSPAYRSHLEPGDFIIFIDKLNIVDMKISDVLSLINKSCVLSMEVFRRADSKIQIRQPLTTTVAPVVVTKIEPAPKCVQQNCIESVVEVTKAKLISKGSTESKRKHLTFGKEESITSDSADSQKSFKLFNNILHCECQFMSALSFGCKRYIDPLRSRKDLVSSKEHEMIFKNIEKIMTLLEIVMKSNSPRDSLEAIVKSYKASINELMQEYEQYVQTMPAVDNIILEKTHHPEFVKFIANPAPPSNQPLFHNFIKKPLEFHGMLKTNFQIMLGQSKIDSQEYQDLSILLNLLQIKHVQSQTIISSRTTTEMEAKSILRNMESRLVFTKCNPFKLDMPGREWIFGGDLTRIEANSFEKPFYTLLFSDIIVFSTSNRDRVLFLTEEPIPIKSIVESFFNIRKKEKEFRLTIETNPNYIDHSPTTHRCTPDLIRKSPLRQSRRKNICLRAPSEEMKKVWQNLITKQVFNINSVGSETKNHEDLQSVLLIENPSNQTDQIANCSTNKLTESKQNICLTQRKSNSYAYETANEGNSVVVITTNEVKTPSPKTPETPSCANLSSINENFIKSLSSMSFGSSKNINSECNDSEYGDILNGFDTADRSFANDVKECIFMQNDPFFADES